MKNGGLKNNFSFIDWKFQKGRNVIINANVRNSYSVEITNFEWTAYFHKYIADIYYKKDILNNLFQKETRISQQQKLNGEKKSHFVDIDRCCILKTKHFGNIRWSALNLNNLRTGYG